MAFGGDRRGKLGLGRRVEITAAFLGILVAGFVLGPKIEGAFDGGGDVRLEIDEITVSNPPAEYTSAGEFTQIPTTEPTVAATVRNRGDETAWIEEARVTLVAGARLRTCVSQGGGGDVPHSKRYRITLPEFPDSARRVFRRDLHVEVQPGHGVRPVVSFQKDDFGTTNLYAIHVELVADPGGRLLDAGRFVIGVPEPVSRSGQVLPESDETLLSEATVQHEPRATWCFRHNVAGMRRVIAEPGRRSDYVAALAHMRFASAWGAYADNRPTRLVVADLLRNDDPEAALYAVEAAERSNDPRYEATVRARAVSLLLKRATEYLDDYPAGAVEEAERALSLGASSAASRLLAQAKAHRRAEEEEERAGV